MHKLSGDEVMFNISGLIVLFIQPQGLLVDRNSMMLMNKETACRFVKPVQAIT